MTTQIEIGQYYDSNFEGTLHRVVDTETIHKYAGLGCELLYTLQRVNSGGFCYRTAQELVDNYVLNESTI